MDRDLLRAAPDGLRQALTELNPSGAFNLQGSINLAQGGHPADPLVAGWKSLAPMRCLT